MARNRSADIASIMYIVRVEMIPLNGCHTYGYVSRNQSGSTGELWAKYGKIDLSIKESTINMQSNTDNLEEKILKVIKNVIWSNYLLSDILIR